MERLNHPSAFERDQPITHSLVVNSSEIPDFSNLGNDYRDGKPRVWQDFANCAGIDTLLFIRSNRGDQEATSFADAKGVCLSCVAKEPCLQYALDNNIDDGIWGGMNGRERRRVRRQQELAGRSALATSKFL